MRKFQLRAICLGIFLFFIAGCGGGGGGSNSGSGSNTSVTSVTINPTSVTLSPGGTQQFTAQVQFNTVTSTSNTAVIWSVMEKGGGTLSSATSLSVLYSAPSIAGNFHVIATSVADTTKTATATVNVPPPPTITTFSANPSTITVGQSATLSWNISGATSVSINQGVGTVTPVASGTLAVSPTRTTIYTLTASGVGGQTTAFTTVTVQSMAVNITVN